MKSSTLLGGVIAPLALHFAGFTGFAFALQAAPLPFGGGFVENGGQWNPQILAAADGDAVGIGLVDDGLQLTIRGESASLSLRLRWSEANELDHQDWVLNEPLPGRHHYLIGDPEFHAEHLTPHASAILGSRLQVRSGARRWTVESRGANIEFDVDGAEVTGLASSGDLLLEADGRSWSLAAPGFGPSQAGRWVVTSSGRVAVRAGAEFTPFKAAVQVSPSIDWGTYLGADGGQDYGRGSTYDSAWRPLTCGQTFSTEFPTAVGPFTTAPGGGVDGFLTKLTEDGSELVFSTYIGGTAEDYLVAVDTSHDDEIAILGFTQSANWPTTPGAYDSSVDTSGPGYAVGVVRLLPDGSAPVFSTFFGDQVFDGFPRVSTIAKDDGTVLLCGDSGGVPYTPGSAFESSFFQGSFLAKFSADGSELLFSTHPPCMPFMAELSDGSIVVAGDGGYSGWGLPTSYQDSPGGAGSFDAWVGVVSPDGKDLLAATYLGGIEDDSCRGVGVDALDNIYIAGTTVSDTFPKVGSPFGWEPNNMAPGYVARFNRGLSDLHWTVLLGTEPLPNSGSTSGQTSWQGLSSDESGVVTVAGWGGANLPYFTTGAHTPSIQTNSGRVARIAPDGSRLLYAGSAEWPGPADLSTAGIRQPAIGRSPRTSLFSGSVLGTFDPFHTSPGTFKDTCTGDCSVEAYLSQWSFFHEGVELLGDGGESCLGLISLNTTRRADVGATNFAFYVSQAPPASVGVLLLGAPLPLPLAIEGQTLWIDAGTLLPLQLLATMESGYGVLDLEIPPAAAGKTFAAQAAILRTDSCGPAGSLVLSEAVSVSVL